MINSCAVQYSDDNSSWTTLFSIASQSGWGTDESRVFTYSGGYPATSKVWWRINVTANDGHFSALSAATVQMRTAVGGADQCSGGAPGASSYYIYTSRPDKLYDGNASTWWAANFTTGWMSYQFAAVKQIVEVVISARNDSNPEQSPKNFTVQYWDGAAWQTQWTVTNSTGWTTGETRTFADPSPPAAPQRGNICVCT
jgi:hypothetical protein